MEHHTNNRPHHHHHGGGSVGGGGGGREDCWSEGATAVLIEAWGDRYLQLSRGNLRQKDWKEVADAVNNRHDGSKKPPRTDIQCKNRIDTIKKKYKLEKSKAAPSQWPFFTRLDQLIGTATTTAAANKKVPPYSSVHHHHHHKSSPAVTFTVRNGKNKLYSPNPNPNQMAVVYSGGSSSKSRLNSHGSTESSGGGGGGEGEEEEEDDTGDEEEMVFDRSRSRSSRKGKMDRNSTDGSAFRELARAVSKFGEIYERIESSKQQQMMELERQRMDFTKELEFQRMQMFMEAQLELEKMKRPKYSSSTGKK